MKKMYIQPAVNVQKIETEAILAASATIGASTNFDESNDIDESQIEAKKYGNVSCWDDEEL